MSVLIFEGMKVGVLPGDFSIHIDESGQTHSNVVLSTTYNVLPLWLRIAHDNIILAHQANNNVKNKKCNKTTTGALLIRNSWGTGWGDRGYGWLPYDYVISKLALDFWSLLRMEWIDTKQFGI